jgi:succinate dehydrogenase/fumarate reductase iron-sulfur protein
MNDNKAIVKIFRFDPSLDKIPRYQEYKDIPYTGRSILDVLRYIYEEYDSSLAFRRLCTKGSCGGCAMRVNGEPVLACQKLAINEMVLEPHPKFQIIKDLVVNFDKVRREKE